MTVLRAPSRPAPPDTPAAGAAPPTLLRRAVTAGRAELDVPLFRNAYALVLNTGATAVLGLAFWVLAARLYPAADLGWASAAISLLTLLSGVGQLNLMGALSRFLPVAGGSARRLVAWSYSVTVAVSLAAGAAGALVLDAGTGVAVWFAVAVAAWTVFTLQDSVLAGLRQAQWVPVENVAFGMVKLALLAALAFAGGTGILAAWTVPVALSLVPVNLLIFRRLLGRFRSPAGPAAEPGLRRVARFAAGDYAGSLFGLAGITVPPLLVAGLLGEAANARFYAAWVIAVAYDVLATNLATSLTVEGALDEGRLAAYGRAVARRAAILLVPLVVGTVVAAPLVLHLFGGDYSDAGTGLLRLLALATLPKALISLYAGVLRVQGRVGRIAALQVASTVATLALAVPLLHAMGIAGAGAAVLVGNGLVAAAVAPGVVRLLRPDRPGPSPSRLLGLARHRRTPAVLLGTAAALLALGLATVDLGRMGTIGLLPTLSPAYLAGLAVLTAGFVTALLGDRLRPALLAGYLAVLILALHGVTGFVEPVPRFHTAWVHAGFVEQILRNGQPIPLLDARYNWPGFFAMAALVAEVAGIDSPVAFLRWAPVLSNLLYLVPLWVITGVLVRNPAARWLGLWLFVVGNWVGQDYFSPQGFNFFLYLVVLAVCLVAFRAAPPAAGTWPGRLRALADRALRLGPTREDHAPPVPLTGGQRAGLFLAVVLLGAAAAVSHQLTPPALVVATAVLALGGWVTTRSLPLVLGVVTLSWISFGAVVFWSGHFDTMFGGIGRVGDAVQANVGGRLHGDTGRLVVLGFRLGITAVVLALAAAGVARRARRGRNDLLVAALAAAPFGLMTVQGYGGEILMRSYLLALPFAAVGAARAFLPDDARRSVGALVAAGGVCVALAGGFLVARYGNEQYESFTRDEVALVSRLYARAEPGSTLVAPTFSLPWQFTMLEAYQHRSPSPATLVLDPTAAVLSELSKDPGRDAYVVITRSQLAQARSVYGLPDGWSDDVVAELTGERGFSEAERNPDGVVLHRPAPDGGGRS